MKNIQLNEISSELAHTCEGASSIILSIHLPEEYTFEKHLDMPTIESADKDICVIQKILRDQDNLNFKIKLNSKLGRTELKLKGDVMLQQYEEKIMADYSIVIPLLISKNGSNEVNCAASF
jgi:hypothetical protein